MDNVTRLLMQGAAGASGDKTYVDDVFSTYLWTGNGSNSAVRTMANGIDLAGEGGMVWIKNRDTANVEAKIVDTVRGLTGSSPYYIMPSESNAQGDRAWNWSFLNNGFSFNQDYADINGNGDGMASWTFRKAKGFFDIVTYTGNGSNRTIAHSLGSVPGSIWIKQLNGAGEWINYHRSVGAEKFLQLNNTEAENDDATIFQDTEPTASVFSVGTHAYVNGNGNTYVAYLFAGGASTATGASSCSFNGTSGLNVAASTGINFGTGTFCVEGWVYVDSLDTSGGYGRFFQLDGPTGNSDIKNLQVTLRPSDNTLHTWSYGGSTNVAINGSVSLKNGWHHIAVVRDSNNLITQYVDGTPDGTAANITTDFSPNGGSPRPAIGHYPAATGYPFDGKISNLRVTVGEPVYTSGFKPPTEPLTTTSQVTSSSNVKLLCCNVISNATGSTVTPGAISNNGTNPVAYGNNPFDDPGGFKFGEEGDQNLIKCGSYIGSGSAGLEVNLGWEPQFLIIKRSNATKNWTMFDNMRGIVADGNDAFLYPNLSDAESATGDQLDLTPTGFKIKVTGAILNGSGDTYIWMAIRRPDGYVGKPAEAGTDAFAMDTGAGSSTIPNFDSGFPVDLSLIRNPDGSSNWWAGTRLTAGKEIRVNGIDVQLNWIYGVYDSNVGWQNYSSHGSSEMSWMWKRHAGFDVVTYMGNGSSGRTFAHSLGRTPEMMWLRGRGPNQANWYVYHKDLDNPHRRVMHLETTDGQLSESTGRFNDTSPTATHFTIGINSNNNNDSHVVMLFASVDGISKVGSYTGNGSASGPTITLGFAPRFILIKCTTGGTNWFQYDTLRGLVSGDDKRLLLNSSSNQVDADDIDPTATGFQVVSTWDQLNGNTQKYVYYAHA